MATVVPAHLGGLQPELLTPVALRAALRLRSVCVHPECVRSSVDCCGNRVRLRPGSAGEPEQIWLDFPHHKTGEWQDGPFDFACGSPV
jgi:hypothetical protein